MSQEAHATIAGYATADPTFRMTKGGTELAHVRVACTPRRVNQSGAWEDADSSYFTVTCWRKLAVAVRASIRKGDPVLVRGRMRTRTWKTEDKTVTEIEIDADAMGHDLTRGWATFNRGSRPPVETADHGEEARQAIHEEESKGEGEEDDRDNGGSDGSVASDAGPWEPIAPAATEEAEDILTEPAVADLTEADASELAVSG
jgi:single-strand DNA-binding protein